MRQTLFLIPLDRPWSLGPLGEVPGFGFGLVLLFWLLVGAVWLVRNRRSLRLSGDVAVPAVIWLAIAVVIVKLPALVHRGTDRSIAQLSAVIETAGRPAGTQAADLARVLLERGRLWETKQEFDKAVADYKQAIALAPNLPAAHQHLAWLRATLPVPEQRDAAEALAHAQRAAELSGFRSAAALDALAAAHAEGGDFEAAAERAAQAAVTARSSQNADAARLPDIRARLAAYQAGQPRYERLSGKSVPVYGYGFMLFLGFFAAGWTAVRRAGRVGLPGEFVWDAAMWVFFAGIAGARLFYIAQYPERVFGGKVGLGKLLAVFNLPDGGLVLYGGVILGIAAFALFCWRRKLNTLRFADVLIPSVFVGLAFGRLGCLMNGCCYGDRCELPWAIQFPIGSVPDTALVSRGFVLADETLVFGLHPSQIYMSLNAVVLAVLTHAYFRYRHRDGSVLALGWLAYPITRFVIEFVRGDEMGQFNTSFTISQWVSMGLFVSGLMYLGWLMRRPASRITAAASAFDAKSLSQKASANATA